MPSPTHPPRVSFFTRGQRTPHNDSYIITNQCYVQYIPPRPPSSQPGPDPSETHTNPLHTPLDADARPPLLFIHGGGLTGAQWESTPDFRPGWAVLAAQGTAPTSPPRHVYMMDGVDSGRSQTAPMALRTAQGHGEQEHRTAKEIWSLFRIGRQEDFDALTTYPDSQFPISHFDGLVGAQSARWRTTDALERQGIIGVINTLTFCESSSAQPADQPQHLTQNYTQPLDIVAYSHGAAMLLDILSELHTSSSTSLLSRINKITLIEPSTATLRSSLDSLPPQIPIHVLWGDYLDLFPVWRPLRQLFHDASTGSVSHVNLPTDLGIKGNSHFPMLDLNSEVVWGVVVKWLDS